MPVFVLLFLIVPFVEIYLLIQVGQQIGALPTIALCVLTAVVGGALLRREGRKTWAAARARLDRGELPANDLLAGIALAVGGALLVTPGFATDLAGFLLLIPATRARLVRAVLAHVVVVSPQPRPPEGGGPSVIEGEYQRKD